MSDEKPSLSARIVSMARASPTKSIEAADLRHLASSGTVHQALSRLARSGYLVRDRRGHYTLSPEQILNATSPAKASKYRHILSASAPLFARQGYYGVSMRDIAKGSGLRIATLYNYFSDKNSLYEAVLKEAWAEGARRTLEVVPPDGSPQDRLRSWIHYVLAFYFEESPSAMLRDRELLIAHARDGPKSDFLAATAESNEAIRQLVVQIDPPIAGSVSPQRIAELIYSLCYGIIKFLPAVTMIDPDRGDLTLRAITEDVLRFVGAALGWSDISLIARPR